MKFVLGTANFNTNYGILKNNLKNKELIKILKSCKKYNIDSIDTAIGYKDLSKNILKIKNNWKIYTKVSTADKSYDKKLTKILKIYNKVKIYLLIHNTNDLKNKNFIEKIKNLRKVKKIQIGISVYSPNEIYKSYEKFRFNFVQAPGNIFDNRFILNLKLKKFLKKNKIKLFIRSIYLQGVLTKDVNFITRKFPGLTKPIARIQSVFGKDENLLKNLSLKWIISNNFISGYVIGVNNKKEFLENLNMIKKFNRQKSKNINQIKDIIKIFKISNKTINPSKWNY